MYQEFHPRLPLHGLTQSIATSVLLAASLALAACGSNKGDLSKIDRSSDTIIATINGAGLYHSDIVDVALATGMASDESELVVGSEHYNRIAQEVIDQRLLSLKAQNLGLDETPMARRRIALTRERILGSILVETHLKNRVTEQAAKKLYTEQIKLRASGDEVRASHILVKDKAAIDALYKRVKAGESFADLAKTNSIDPGSALKGGDLGYFQAELMVPEFSKVAFALDKGAVSEPVETQFGWHIIKAVDRRESPVPSFESLKDEITNYLTMDEIGKLLSELRSDSEVEMKVKPAPLQAAPSEPSESEPTDDQ